MVTRSVSPDPSASDEAGAKGVQRAPEGELRHVTILFSDVVRSTQVVLSLSPSETRLFLDRATDVMAAAVRKFGGSICDLPGDGMMAVFGTPAATEDHALRAALAATEIRNSFVGLKPAPGIDPLRVRVGLHSGGASTSAEGDGDRFRATGAVVHLASKIQRLAPPGSIAASATTIRLIRGFVRSQSLGALALDTDDAPLAVEELLEVSPDYRLEHFFSRRRINPLVGRSVELRALADAMVGGPDGGVALGIVGDAGLGKSRLCHEAQAIAQRDGRTVFEIRGIGLNHTTPFAALAPLLTQLLHADAAATEDLKAQLQAIGVDPPEIDAIAAILRLNRGEGDWRGMSAEQRKQGVVAGAQKIIAAALRRGPLTLIVEDAHDMDRETLESLQQAASALKANGLSLIVTGRPEAASAIAALCDRVITLKALPKSEARKLVQSELRNTDAGMHEALKNVQEDLLTRANGNPFMLEELFRSLLSARTRGLGIVPMSLEVLIRARIDRLSPTARSVLQSASAIGVRCSADALRRVANCDPTAFETALKELVDERFLVADAGLRVEFVHQITRDACYEGIAPDLRMQLHQRVLDAAGGGQDGPAFSLEALAEHAQRAGKLDLALDYLWEACRAAIAHSAIHSVVAMRKRAHALCAAIGPAADLRAAHFDLLTFDASHQLGVTDELIASLESTLRVAQAAGQQRLVCQVSSHLATTYWIRGDYRGAEQLARSALKIARDSSDVPLANYSTYVLACIFYNRGKMDEAVKLQRGVCATLSGDLAKSRFGAVVLLSVASRSFLCCFLTDTGDADEAKTLSTEAIAIAEASDQTYSQILAYCSGGYRLLRTGDAEGARALLAKANAICQAGAFLSLDQTVSGWYAAALLACGDYDEAWRIISRSLEEDLGSYCGVIGSYYVYDAYARLLARAGRREEALLAADRAVEFSLETRDPVHYAYGAFTRLQVQKQFGAEPSALRCGFQAVRRRARRLGMKPLLAQCERALGNA